MTIRVVYFPDEFDGMTVHFNTAEEVEMLKQLVFRATNHWPDAPPEVKEFADIVTHGEPLQNYYLQDTSGKKQQSLSKPQHQPQLPEPIMSLEVTDRQQLEVLAHDAVLTTPDGYKKTIPYGEFVATLAKKLPRWEDDVMHAAIGIAGEGGEILDACKKTWIYNKPLDTANVIEECGDIMFYMTALLMLNNATMDDVINANVEKLQKRYPGMQYTDAAAQARADKAEAA